MSELKQLPLKYALLGLLVLVILGWVVWRTGSAAGERAAKSDCVNNIFND
ncbi:hypothetical protein ACAW74_18175 [Fibrella sp. WM1]